MRKFFNAIFYLLAVHLSGLLVLTLLRLALYLVGYDWIQPEFVGNTMWHWTTFVRGLWFDNVIGCYILVVPLFAAVVSGVCGYGGKWLLRPAAVFMQILYGIAFLISAANIPYFQYFFKNINSSIFNWFEYGGTTLSMLLEEPSYYPPLLGFLLLLVLFVWATFRMGTIFLERDKRLPTFGHWTQRVIAGLAGLLLVGACVFGIRGRTGYNPIKVSAAYHCEDAFLNQLGVNPAFNLLTSALDDQRPENKRLHLMDDALAVANVQQYLQRNGDADISPLYYNLPADTIWKTLAYDSIRPKQPNVVVLMLESLSASLMQSYGQEKELTPFLDSLYARSIVFPDFYSAGIHTNHAMYATLYSFPAMMKRNLMKGSSIPLYSGLPQEMQQAGYRTMFFMTHESQYDNMNAFFRTNGFDEIYAQENYPAEKVVNGFGVQDDYLYEYALEVLNEKHSQGQPFMAALLSISNHPPYIIPPYFTPKTEDIKDQIVEYTDWAVRKFFEEARRQPWFENTVFVIEGDHGKLVGAAECELPRSYNHVPLMIYSPLLRPRVQEGYATQMDIQPTLLALLGLEARQNNFGVNLWRETRPFVFYTADDMIAARTRDRLYLYAPDTDREYGYLLSPTDKKGDVKLEKTEVADSLWTAMKDYAFSMLQAAEELVSEEKTLNYSKADKNKNH